MKVTKSCLTLMGDYKILPSSGGESRNPFSKLIGLVIPVVYKYNCILLYFASASLLCIILSVVGFLLKERPFDFYEEIVFHQENCFRPF